MLSRILVTTLAGALLSLAACDRASAGPDAGLPVRDAASPATDARMDSPDGAAVGADAAAEGEDGAVIGPDAAAEGPDAARIGALEHVSLGWIEGWACTGSHGALDVEIFATDAPGDGSCRPVHDGGTACRVAAGQANVPRRAVAAAECGAAPTHDYRIRTPAALLDGRTREFFAVVGGEPLAESLAFGSDLLYTQEPISDIDEHLLIDGVLPFARDASFSYDYHTHFVFWPADGTLIDPTAPPGVEVVPLADAIGDETGFAPPAPLELHQRSVGPVLTAAGAGCRFEGATRRCHAVQASGDRLGIRFDNLGYNVANGVMLLQTVWPDADRPAGWRPGAPGDRVRISVDLSQPRRYPDGPGSPDNVSLWYFILVLEDRASPSNRSVWLVVHGFRSRWGLPDPSASRTWVDYEGLFAGYVEMPLAPSALWLTPCAGSAAFGDTAHADEWSYCFEVSGAQLAASLRQFNADVALSDATQPAEKRFGPVSEEPGDYRLQTFGINLEAWGVGDDGLGHHDVSNLALSLRNLTVRKIPAP